MSRLGDLSLRSQSSLKQGLLIMSNARSFSAMHKVAPILTSPYFISVIASAMLMGCASSPSKSSELAKSERAANFQRRALLRELKRKQSTIDELRDRNLVLEKKLQLQTGGVNASAQASSSAVPMPFEPSAANEISQAREGLPELPASAMLPAPQVANGRLPASTVAGAGRVNPPEQTNAAPQPDANVAAEQTHYEKVLAAYAHHDKAAAASETESLIKAFPDSIFADNALYLNGLLAVENHDVTRGMYYMNRVLKEYPQGNKAVAALFAKSMLEKQARNFAAATNDFHLLNKLYPGSPEAKRVALELKTMQLPNAKREM